MRRGINTRKRKKIFLQEMHKRSLKILSSLIILIILCISIYFFFFQDISIKRNFEQSAIDFSNLNEDIPFSIRKIVLFSSATAESDNVNELLSLSISQYCDIGIYLCKSTNSDILINSLYIDNIVISSPEIGTPYLYKKTIPDLGKCSFDDNNIINDSFYFNIVDTNTSLDYNNYEIYNDTTTPISLGFYNKNIKTGFFPSNSVISYNGTLLKDATIPLTSLNCNISFKINIITTSNEHYVCNINIDIPFESEEGYIYDNGYVTKEFSNTETNKFIRLK